MILSFRTAAGILVMTSGLLLSGLRGEVPQSYFAGGTQPWPEELKAQLDEHADILSLGINIDWLEKTRIDAELYVEAIARTAEAVKAGRLPGAVVHVGRLDGTMLPIAVGHVMCDPRRMPLHRTTRYSVQDLTGPVVTVPLVFQAINDRKLSHGTRLEEHFGELEGTALGRVSVLELLQHRSGLPGEWPHDEAFEDRSGLLAALAEWHTEPEVLMRASPSALNYAVLGMLVEEVTGESLRDMAVELFGDEAQRGAEDPLIALAAADGLRHSIAPGRYSERLRRMVWAEPDEPVAELLTPHAGHWGLITSADALAAMVSRSIMASAIFEGWARRMSVPMVGESAPRMGPGVMSGRFGPDSFGWDSPTGSSVWALPSERAYIIFLSNMDHPDGVDPEADDPRDVILPLLAEAIGWQKESQPAREERETGR